MHQGTNRRSLSSSHLVAATLASLLPAITAGCGGGGGAPSSSTPTFSGNTNVTLLATSTANDTFWQLTAVLQSLTLTDQSGKTVAVLSSPVVDEFMHLNGNVEPLATVSIPQGVYTGATLTVEVAFVECTEQDQGEIYTDQIVFMPAPGPVTVNLPQSITVTGTAMGLALNLQVSQSVPPIGSCAALPTPISIVGNPVFTLAPVPLASQSTNSGNGKMMGLVGITKAIAGNSMSVSSLWRVNGGPPASPAWQFQLDSKTVFQGISGGSQLAAGLLIEMDAAVQPDGSLLATRVDVLDTSPSNLSAAFGFLMSPYNRLSGTDVLVEESSLNQAPFMYGFGSAQFRMSGQFTNLQSLPFTPKFDSTSFAWGQNVLISSHAGGNGPWPVPMPTTTATLVPQTVDGVVTAVASEGSFTTYTINLAPYDLFPNLDVQPQEPTLVVNPGTIVVYADNNTQLNNTAAPTVGHTARFYGLVFNDGGTLRMDCAQISSGVQQ